MWQPFCFCGNSNNNILLALLIKECHEKQSGWMQKSLQTTFHCYSFCNINSINFANLSQGWKNLTQKFLFCSSSFFSPSFFLSPSHITRKLYNACKYCTYQTTSLLLGTFVFWFGTAYKLQLVIYIHETVSGTVYLRRSCSATYVAGVYVFWVCYI